MTTATSGKNGSLSAEILEIKMEIDDDDEDVIQVTVSISNEAPVPMVQKKALQVSDQG